MHTTRFSLFLSFVLCLVLAVPMWGQATNTGSVVGTVTDPSGAVVPAATVTLTDISTATALDTVTNSAGHYVFVNVNPGIYDLTINKQGFSTTKVLSKRARVEFQTPLTLHFKAGPPPLRGKGR